MNWDFFLGFIWGAYSLYIVREIYKWGQNRKK